MTCADHLLVRTEDLASDGGGAICVIAGDEEIFLDAERCASCGAIELVVHEKAELLEGPPGEPCPRCGGATRDLGEQVCSQGGTQIHAPMDDRWTFGLKSRVCGAAHVTVSRIGGEHRDDAPANAELIARNERAGPCPCGGTRHSLALESHHSGFVRADGRIVFVHVCATCEQLVLSSDTDTAVARSDAP